MGREKGNTIKCPSDLRKTYGGETPYGGKQETAGRLPKTIGGEEQEKTAGKQT